MNICSFCGNRTFQEKRIQYVYKHSGRFLIVNETPCVECVFCGEQYFSAEVLKKIELDYQEITAQRKRAEGEILIPVETFS